MKRPYPKENLYQVLGVSIDSDIADINSGYERMLERYRNDKPENLLHVKRKFSQKPSETDHEYDQRMRRQQAHILYVIRTAKEVLSDPVKRADYDTWLEDPQIYQEKQKRAASQGDTSQNAIIKMPNGDTYEGETKNNVPHGKGRLFSPRGTIVFDGEWKNGVLHGYGISYDANGNKLQNGRWEGGSFIESSDNGENLNPTKNHDEKQTHNTVQTFSVRPFFLVSLFKFASRGYGVTKTSAYQKTDFCGIGQFSRTDVPLDKIGTPSYKGIFWGEVHIPGLLGENSVTWENVLMPAQQKARVERAVIAYKGFVKNNEGFTL